LISHSLIYIFFPSSFYNSFWQCEIRFWMAWFIILNNPFKIFEQRSPEWIYAFRRLFRIRSGKARADFGGRGVVVYISPSKSVNNAVQNGF
ncbi:MAG: hypothetical protein KMY51_12620, partial [Desulfomicrobium sp.]|nr:hypothetical protein [Desulfomicrobium sp.]